MTKYFPSAMFDSGDIQTSIFNGGERQLQYAELCNALFEACLTDISNQNELDLPKLKRRLAGLSYHIKSAAFKLLTSDNHLDVDIHNGSWQHKQPKKCPGIDHQDAAMVEWYSKYSCFGLAVPVLIKDIEQYIIEIDSIDRIDHANQRIHLNKHGWVELRETQVNSDTYSTVGQQLVVLQKPSKALMTSACCGHRWTHRGITHPRRLSLRELLLSTTISWKNFRFPL